jgi:hypothetical protein
VIAAARLGCASVGLVLCTPLLHAEPVMRSRDPSVYGSASNNVPQKRPVASSQVVEEAGTRLAHWGGGDYSLSCTGPLTGRSG